MKKKSMLLMMTAILALTGCENETEETSADISVNNAETTAITENKEDSSEMTAEKITTMKDDKKFLSRDEIEETFLAIVEDYYKGTEEADFDKCFGNFPDFYLEMLEKEVEVCKQTHEEYMQSIHDYYVETYGEDFSISFVVTEDKEGSKGILNLEQSLVDFEEVIKETYGKDIHLQEAYTIYLTTTTKGSVNAESIREEWFMLKIDGKYYIYENYYESNTIGE